MPQYSPGPIRKLPRTAASLGLLTQFISGHGPFTQFDFGPLVYSLLKQIETGSHLVMTRQDHVVGYLGWLRTTDQIATEWQEAGGKLSISDHGTAVAVTVMAVEDPRDSIHLIRAARHEAPNASVYWKRYYQDGRPASPRRVLKSDQQR